MLFAHDTVLIMKLKKTKIESKCCGDGFWKSNKECRFSTRHANSNTWEIFKYSLCLLRKKLCGELLRMIWK